VEYTVIQNHKVSFAPRPVHMEATQYATQEIKALPMARQQLVVPPALPDAAIPVEEQPAVVEPAPVVEGKPGPAPDDPNQPKPEVWENPPKTVWQDRPDNF
jgi:hypothetical protein